MIFKKSVKMTLLAALCFVCASVMFNGTVRGEEQNNKTYHGYLGFQTCAYSFHDTWNDAQYGLNSKKLDYNTNVGYWSNGDLKTISGTFDNSQMVENETYSVKMSGFDMKHLSGTGPDDVPASRFLMLYVSTDIPLSMPNVTAKNVSLKVDGKVVKTYKSIPCKNDAKGYYQFMLANIYAPNAFLKKYHIDNCLYYLPTSSLEITYSLEGADFAHDYSKLKIGKKITKDDFTYKITSAGKVKAVSLTSAAKKSKKLVLPEKIDLDGISFDVTSVGSKCFTDAKAKTIALNSNITKIPSKTFYNCKKLKTLQLGAKLSKTTKNAFAGCPKVKITGKYAKQNKKMIK